MKYTIEVIVHIDNKLSSFVKDMKLLYPLFLCLLRPLTIYNSCTITNQCFWTIRVYSLRKFVYKSINQTDNFKCFISFEVLIFSCVTYA